MHEQRRIVTYLDGLYPNGDASQQARANVMRAAGAIRERGGVANPFP